MVERDKHGAVLKQEIVILHRAFPSETTWIYEQESGMWLALSRHQMVNDKVDTKMLGVDKKNVSHICSLQLETTLGGAWIGVILHQGV